jgi:dihydroflavonol-4-reductase
MGSSSLSIPALPHFGFALVDVRDIAALQLLAMTTPSAAGQRFIGSCEFYWMADIAKILKQGLGDKARAAIRDRPETTLERRTFK